MKKESITVGGLSFCADEVVSAVIKKDGREIVIQSKPDAEKRIGFVTDAIGIQADIETEAEDK